MTAPDAAPTEHYREITLVKGNYGSFQMHWPFEHKNRDNDDDDDNGCGMT